MAGDIIEVYSNFMLVERCRFGAVRAAVKRRSQLTTTNCEPANATFREPIPMLFYRTELVRLHGQDLLISATGRQPLLVQVAVALRLFARPRNFNIDR